MTKTAYTQNENDVFVRSPVNSRRPTREPNVKSDVHVPMQSGLVAAGFVFMLFIGFVIYRETTPTLSYFGLAFIVSMLVGLIVFFWRMQWASKVIWAIETVAQKDFSHDGQIGEPARPILFNNMSTKNRKPDPKTEYQKRFREFVIALYEQGTNHHALRSQFSENEIVKFRQYCIDLGIAKWKNDKAHQTSLELIVDQMQAEYILDTVPWVDVESRTKRK